MVRVCTGENVRHFCIIRKAGVILIRNIVFDMGKVLMDYSGILGMPSQEWVLANESAPVFGFTGMGSFGYFICIYRRKRTG